MAKTPEELENTAEQADITAERLATLKSSIQSITDAYSKFNEAVQKEGLANATKQFYSLIEGMKEYQKKSGDIYAASEETQEKITLLGQAVNNATNEIRNSSIQIKNNKELLNTLNEELKDFNKTSKDAEEELQKLQTTLSGLSKEQTREKETLEKEIISLQVFIDKSKQRAEVSEQVIELEEKLSKLASSVPLARYEKTREEALAKTRDYMGDILSKLTSGAEKTNIFGSVFLAMQKGVDGTNVGLTGLFKTIGQGFKQSLLDPELAFNRIFNLINDKLIKSTFEFDKALAAVGKSTGGFRKEFEAVAMNMGGVSFGSLTQYGVNLEKFGQAYQGLSRSIGSFNNLSEQQRRLLTENAAVMANLGVSADNYGKLTAKFMNTIGESAERSSDLINKLAKDAIALGKSVDDYTSHFEVAMSRITGYGRNAISIFKELEAVSSSTMGVVTSQDLLAISDKFKDFESAADSVSKLNAVLGGTSVNILDMMRADPAEQIMMIKRAAGEAGLEFDKLNIGYKRLLAEYFGGDVLKAQKFFNSNLSDATAMINKQVESEEELAKRKQQNIDFQQKLNALLDNMKVALTPVLDSLNTVFSLFSNILSFPGSQLVLTFGMITGAIKLAKMAMGNLFSMVGNLSRSKNELAASSAQASANEIRQSQQETSWIRQKITLMKELVGLEKQRSVTSTAATGAPAVGSGFGKAASLGKTVGLFAGLGLAQWGLSELSDSLSSKREKELEVLKSQLKREELDAQGKLYGSKVTRAMEPQEDTIVVVKDTGEVSYIPLKGYGGESDNLVGMKKESDKTLVGFGTSSGQAKPMISETTTKQLMQERNTEFTKTINTAEKSSTFSENVGKTVEKEIVKERPSVSSAVEDNKQMSVNVTAYLNFDNKYLSLLTEKVTSEIKEIQS
jgi:hypothetical protein